MIKKIAIIGGGIAGLTAAIGLKHSGFAITVFEKAKQFSPLGGDIPLWPNGLRVLDKFGLYQKIKAKSGCYPFISIGNEAGDLISKTMVDDFHKIAPYDPINICRHELQAIQLAALESEEIILDKTCIRIEETEEHVIAHFHDGSKFAADLLIGADGAFSFIRNHIEPEYKLEYTGYLSLGGISELPYHIRHNLIFGQYLSGNFPVDGNKHMIFFICKHADCDIHQTYPLLADQLGLFRNHAPILNEMLDNLEQSINKNHGLKNYFFVKNYNLQPLNRWSKNRIVLISDAAHLVGSILGCATSVSLEGVEMLIECLNQSPDNYSIALKKYEVLHKPRATRLLSLERKLAEMLNKNELGDYPSFSDDLISCLKSY